MSDLLLSLRTFVRLAEMPNFSRVATEMHASHTTIARRLDQVEAHFGVPLFHRTTRRLVPTADADRLLVHIRAMLDALDQAESDSATNEGQAKEAQPNEAQHPLVGMLRELPNLKYFKLGVEDTREESQEKWDLEELELIRKALPEGCVME